MKRASATVATLFVLVLATGACGLTPRGAEPLVPLEPLVPTPPGALPSAPPTPAPIEALVLPEVAVRELPHDMTLTVGKSDRPTTELCVVFRKGGDTMRLRHRWSLEIMASVLARSQGLGGATGRVASGQMRVCRGGHPSEAPSVARALARMVTAPRWDGHPADAARARAESSLTDRVRSTTFRGVVLAEQQLLGTATPDRLSERLADVSFDALHGELAQSGQVAFVAVGAVDVERLAAALTEILEPWQPVDEPAPAVSEPEGVATYDGADVVVWRGGYARANLSVATAAPSAHGVDVDAFFILWHALDGSLTGRLYQALRIGESSAYSVGSIGWLGPERGTFVVSTSVDSEHVVGAVRALVETLDRVRAGLTPEELRVGKLHRREGLRLGLETTGGVARTLTNVVALDRDLQSLQERDRAIAALSSTDLRRVAAAYIGRRSPVIVLADDDTVEELLGADNLNVFDAGSLPGHRSREDD